ncbi:DUF3489 domain-containing protein [Stutzerimonas balearica]|jgi:hypothetical protein|uniref:DUF3489 domain-containing protein n=1 Tax=Stutzerimonas balearica TaxID=74829 RepID=UPI0022B07416|nr:DUF3489 domain-containing protein [Stutzerimonas balearica]MCZ4130059.1 DUF3489 domain-containing protein [Stutzerimonas balearica]
MSNQIAPITERQLDLITRAHCDANGLIEPLLELKGGAKLKMIASLASRNLIEQAEGQWRLTRTAIAILKGEAKPEEVLPSPLAADDTTEQEAIPTSAEAPLVCPASEPTPAGRGHSKQALVIEMLKRPEGVTIAQICEATGWQAHTVRGTFAGALKKKLGLNIVSEKIEGPAGSPGAGQRLYRISEEVSV